MRSKSRGRACSFWDASESERPYLLFAGCCSNSRDTYTAGRMRLIREVRSTAGGMRLDLRGHLYGRRDAADPIGRSTAGGVRVNFGGRVHGEWARAFPPPAERDPAHFPALDCAH